MFISVLDDNFTNSLFLNILIDMIIEGILITEHLFSVFILKYFLIIDYYVDEKKMFLIY